MSGNGKSPGRLSVLVGGIRWPPETFLARLVRGLLAAGVQVTVASSGRPGREWQAHEGFSWIHTPDWQQAPALRLAALGRMAGGALARAPRHVGWVARQAAQNGDAVQRLLTWYRLLPFAGRRWDLLYFPWNGAAALYLPLFELGAPVVLSCRGTGINVDAHDPERPDYREKLALTFGKAAAVHCVSEAIREEALPLGLDPAKAHVIRPAVDPNFFRPAPAARRERAAGTFEVVATGSYLWQKGFEYALSAVRRLVDRGVPVRFTLIGDGPEAQRLHYTIHDLALQEHVDLPGRLPPEQVRDRLQQADAFLLSSVSEGISNAVLEAMACGLPVVTTACGGMREVVTDGVEGYVVPVRSAESMAEALARIHAAPAVARAQGAAARQRVLQAFTLDRQVEQFHALFRRCIESAPLHRLS